MARQAKELVSKPDDPSLISSTHRGLTPLSSTCALWHIHTHTINVKKKMKWPVTCSVGQSTRYVQEGETQMAGMGTEPPKWLQFCRVPVTALDWEAWPGLAVYSTRSFPNYTILPCVQSDI